MSPTLLSPFKTGNLAIRNRVILAPLTRRRASSDHLPTPIMATYYSQRSSAGLLISEAAPISPQAVGYMNVPGIWNQHQVEAWKPVTKAVHDSGSYIFMQLWHVGRISHSLLQPDQGLPVSASAISAGEIINTPGGHKRMEVPRALDVSEIPGIVNDFAEAAKNAIEAGFDGVEIHAANGYLIDQFLHSSSNIRTDQYGGSFGNRSRLLFEVVEEIVKAIGSHKVGIRLSPSIIKNGMNDPDPAELFTYVIKKLNDYNLAYLHLIEPMSPLDKHPHMITEVTKFFRPVWNGPLITAGNYTPESGNEAIEQGIADMVAFGRLFISNPDLPERIASMTPLNEPDTTTFYAGGEKGYTDYPMIK